MLLAEPDVRMVVPRWFGADWKLYDRLLVAIRGKGCSHCLEDAGVSRQRIALPIVSRQVMLSQSQFGGLHCD